MLDKLDEAQGVCFQREQIPLVTEHVLHAGMYARTVTMPPNALLIGTLIKIPTLVITVGQAMVLVGEEWAEVNGYRVIPALAHRKQMFRSIGPFIITMLFPTDARNVEDAEAAFTAETALLLSRRQNFSTVTITEREADH